MNNLFYYSTPLSLLCFVCFTASGEYLFYAQGNLESHEQVVGFPFIWVMDGVNSLSILIAIIPLAMNMIIYFFVCSVVVYPLLAIFHNNKWLKIGIPTISVLLIIPWLLTFSLSEAEYLLNFDLSGYNIMLENYHFTFYAMIE